MASLCKHFYTGFPSTDLTVPGFKLKTTAVASSRHSHGTRISSANSGLHDKELQKHVNEEFKVHWRTGFMRQLQTWFFDFAPTIYFCFSSSHVQENFFTDVIALQSSRKYLASLESQYFITISNIFLEDNIKRRPAKANSRNITPRGLG